MSEHFRSAAYHLLYDTVSMHWQVKRWTQAEKKCFSSIGVLVRPRLSAVLVHGIGWNAYFTMLRKGVSVWMTKAQTAGEALQAWQSGLLVPILEEELCDNISRCEKGRAAGDSPGLLEKSNNINPS
ncbi:MAG: NifB/NifX family molybdenum-iron cluster-binding protein [Verrucomicrobiae bacterium]|nr:NifB/NifX family molybdenum-iron cluster-binding protein [Verrucomicrobiae bacterium]